PPIQVTAPADYTVCDDASNDGVATFDLQTLVPQVLGTLNPADYIVTIHNSSADANGDTGAITLTTPFTTTTPGTQIVYIRVESATLATCFQVVAVNLVVTPLPVATFSYSAAEFCNNAANPSPVLVGVAGVFSATPAGLVIDPATGTIDLAGSTPGVYTVTNFIVGANGCVDVTATNIFAGNDASYKYTFFEDAALNVPLADPRNIAKTTIVYVKAINTLGCLVTSKIEVIINDSPVLVVKNPPEVCYPGKVDITDLNLFQGSTERLTYSFYTNEALTEKLTNPRSVGKTGTYYVKATNASGCYAVDKVQVIINKLPILVINKPKPIFDYDYVDLTSSEIIKGSKEFVKASYYHDALLSKPVSQPDKVNKAGIYYISLQNEKGCLVSAPVELNILPQPKILVPTAFTPHKETNNRLYPFLVSIQKLTSFKVFNKWGILVYQTDLATNGWDGQFKSKMQPLETFSWFAEGIDTFGGKFQTTGKTILIL
ncbi:MAG: hypothetical protein EOO92_22445, partial [Pedobacter sp.]